MFNLIILLIYKIDMVKLSNLKRSLCTDTKSSGDIKASTMIDPGVTEKGNPGQSEFPSSQDSGGQPSRALQSIGKGTI